jgi:hypothetical protein
MTVERVAARCFGFAESGLFPCTARPNGRVSPPPDIRSGQGFIPKRGDAFRDDLVIRTAFALVNKTWKHGGGKPMELAENNIGAITIAGNGLSRGGRQTDQKPLTQFP